MKALLDCFWLPNYCSYWWSKAPASGNEYLQKKNKSVRWWIFLYPLLFQFCFFYIKCHTMTKILVSHCLTGHIWHVRHRASGTSSLNKTDFFLVTLCCKCLCFKSSKSILAALPHFFLLKKHTLEKKGNTVAPAAFEFGSEESECPPRKSSSLCASVMSVKGSNPKTKLNASWVIVC